MNESYITVTGRMVADPESRTTKLGVPFAAFRLASTVRRLNTRTREYEDGGTSFYNVTAFRSLGANVANSLKKGEPVVVYGRLRVNQWLRADDSHATSVEIDAYTVGHDLSWGTTALTRVSRAQLDTHDRMADEGVQEAMAALEGEAPVVQEDFGSYDPGDLAGRRPPTGQDPETDDYEVVAEPTGEVPREGGGRELATV
ncbi:single-strand DNA-binding protein [Pedococcus dokdonensis]|uniref:Single-strand DNA-binding protein n=1 Tax=Pedococcus dokdonensis TaxID=443156 RepID=A0A1H0QJ29_9MICO|nr:single-stranded DNA-binding protein [Pedococcus dokdonensis]SDP17322.1 single-strand DNA-binding protein [Pedococcus dokdonensis]